MQIGKTKDWRLVVWGAIAITLLSVYPQLVMWSVRGREWNGSFAETDGDEWAYSAYVQSLIDGRPRRNDPYTGHADQTEHTEPESLFSIQFLPAYMIAIPARLLGVSASTAFIVLGVLAPLFSYLAIVWLINTLTGDQRLAAAASLAVLCFGALATGQGLQHLYGYNSLLFLRRYEPSTAFSLFFVFCVLVWKSLTNDKRSAVSSAVTAGLILSILIFSYFYLWTSAAAWLGCVALLWVVRHRDLRKVALPLIIIVAVGLVSLVPYASLLSRRSATMDSGQKLALSHAPDVWRVPELLGLAMLALLVHAVLRKRVHWRAAESLFAASFALMPFVVFNQQVITGRSLQPFHYEVFIANYAALVAIVLTAVAVWRGTQDVKQPISERIVLRLFFLAILWGVMEVVAPTKLIARVSQYTDRAAAVCQRLGQVAKADKTPAENAAAIRPPLLVLASDDKIALMLPTFAPQALLWESHFEFLNLDPIERKKRFYQYLYYTGVDDVRFARDLGQPISNFAAAAFGHDRIMPIQSVLSKPITTEEIAQEVSHYQLYVSSFIREEAAQYLLSYVIVPADGSIDLSNLDHWYQRDQGERIGDHILYRVELRR
jgi:hypothetical protein